VDIGWRVIGASVQGSSHYKQDLPCQDAHRYRILPNGIILLAVADGAGSADRGSEGAHCAVTVMIDSLEAKLVESVPQNETEWQELLVEAFHQAHEALVHRAEAEDIPLHTFATTLTCVVISGEWLVVGQIGDGVVAVMAKDGTLFTITQPQRGEYVNETFFLTMIEALQQVEVQISYQPIQGLVAMTDGLIRLALDLTSNKPYLPFFQPLLAFAAQVEDEAEAHEQLRAFLDSDRVCARTDDDKTLVLATHSSVSESEIGSEPTPLVRP
jgi:hypothetical protein